jgi:hypothetical protein
VVFPITVLPRDQHKALSLRVCTTQVDAVVELLCLDCRMRLQGVIRNRRFEDSLRVYERLAFTTRVHAFLTQCSILLDATCRYAQRVGMMEA